MDIKLTESNARQMAQRLREEIGRDLVKSSKAFEALSKMLGQPNWDTLSGILKREAADSASRLVGTVQELLEVTSAQVRTLLKQQDSLQEAAERDVLTGALNREGFMARAKEAVAQAAKDGSASCGRPSPSSRSSPLSTTFK